jgi:hypothetical protein
MSAPARASAAAAARTTFLRLLVSFLAPMFAASLLISRRLLRTRIAG